MSSIGTTGSPVCKSCGAQMKEGSRFCSQCGILVVQAATSLTCRQCGAKAQAGDQFCGSCGARLEIAAELTWPLSEKAVPKAQKAQRKLWLKHLGPYVLMTLVGVVLSIVGFKNRDRIALIIGLPCSLVGLLYLAGFSRTFAFLFTVGGGILFYGSVEGWFGAGGFSTALSGIGLALAFIGMIGGLLRNLAGG